MFTVRNRCLRNFPFFSSSFKVNAVDKPNKININPFTEIIMIGKRYWQGGVQNGTEKAKSKTDKKLAHRGDLNV